MHAGQECRAPEGWGNTPQGGEDDPPCGEGFLRVLGGQGAGSGCELGSSGGYRWRLHAAGVSEEDLLWDVAASGPTREAGGPVGQEAEDTPEVPRGGVGC